MAERSSRGGLVVREITIPGLVRTLWRGLWLVVAVVVLAVLATALVLKQQVPLYTATMTVAPAEADLSAACSTSWAVKAGLRPFVLERALGNGARRFWPKFSGSAARVISTFTEEFAAAPCLIG